MNGIRGIGGVFPQLEKTTISEGKCYTSTNGRQTQRISTGPRKNGRIGTGGAGTVKIGIQCQSTARFLRKPAQTSDTEVVLKKVTMDDSLSRQAVQKEWTIATELLAAAHERGLLSPPNCIIPKTVYQYEGSKQSQPVQKAVFKMEKARYGDVLNLLGKIFSNNHTWNAFEKILSLYNVTFEDFIAKAFKDIVTAVNFFHERNICHRDLKLGNTFVKEDGTFNVGDVGSAAHADNHDECLTIECCLSTAGPEILTVGRILEISANYPPKLKTEIRDIIIIRNKDGVKELVKNFREGNISFTTEQMQREFQEMIRLLDDYISSLDLPGFEQDLWSLGCILYKLNIGRDILDVSFLSDPFSENAQFDTFVDKRSMTSCLQLMNELRKKLDRLPGDTRFEENSWQHLAIDLLQSNPNLRKTSGRILEHEYLTRDLPSDEQMAQIIASFNGWADGNLQVVYGY
ncbi:hypothetical protein ACFL96_05380 [Thermoproteota archaeon]